MQINSDQIHQLCEYYNEYSDTNAVFLIGSKGLGKSSVIRSFLNNKKNVIHVSVYGKNNYILEPILTALNMYYMSTNNSILNSSNGLDISERINMEIIKICRQEKMILYFENVADYEDSLLIYVKGLLELLVNHYKNLQTFVLFDIDTDNEKNNVFNATLSSLYAISPVFEYIPFVSHDNKNLKEYFNDIFHKNIKITEKDLDYIIDSCSGNLSCLNMIINYLKQTSVIVRNINGYRCAEIKPGSLANILHDNIITRYNLLNDEMKQLLAQSSLIGINFDSQMLYNSFHILKVDEALKRIEGISSLIRGEDNFSYRFENYETYNMILEKIELNERQEWNKLLAIYYEKQLSESLYAEQRISNLYKVAFYYKESLLFNKSIYYYILLIKKEISIIDYKQALVFIREAKDLLIYLNEKNQKIISAVITNYEGECNKLLGQYDSAVLLYQNCLSLYSSCYVETELTNLKLNLSYSLYMNGNLPEALKIATDVKDSLPTDSSEKILLYRTLSFLASIFHLLGDDIQAEEHYIASLMHCKENGLEEEYYIQLKKASMIFDIEVAQSVVRKAANYFEQCNKISYLAETLHNLSTDNLYLLQLDLFQTECSKSIDLFRQYGSLLVHYPMNTMGIYKAIIEQNIDAAIAIFEEILTYNIESFSQVTLQTNLATCYRYKKDFDKCLIHMQIANSLIGQSENKDILLLQTYHYINYALYYKAQGEFRNALSIFQQCLKKLNVQPRHYFLICHYMKDIYLKLKKTIPADVENGCSIITYPLISLYIERNMFFATMRFYE